MNNLSNFTTEELLEELKSRKDKSINLKVNPFINEPVIPEEFKNDFVELEPTDRGKLPSFISSRTKSLKDSSSYIDRKAEIKAYESCYIEMIQNDLINEKLDLLHGGDDA